LLCDLGVLGGEKHKLGSNWLCFFEPGSGIHSHNPFLYRGLHPFGYCKIGFVFSNRYADLLFAIYYCLCFLTIRYPRLVLSTVEGYAISIGQRLALNSVCFHQVSDRMNFHNPLYSKSLHLFGPSEIGFAFSNNSETHPLFPPLLPPAMKKKPDLMAFCEMLVIVLSEV
jgi:hypothetical protein